MRKSIFIFIAIIIVAVSIDWIDACAEMKSHKEVFGQQITYARRRTCGHLYDNKQKIDLLDLLCVLYS